MFYLFIFSCIYKLDVHIIYSNFVDGGKAFKVKSETDYECFQF